MLDPGLRRALELELEVGLRWSGTVIAVDVVENVVDEDAGVDDDSDDDSDDDEEEDGPFVGAIEVDIVKPKVKGLLYEYEMVDFFVRFPVASKSRRLYQATSPVLSLSLSLSYDRSRCLAHCPTVVLYALL
jgi:hypothetical protein